jgi:hypothetical protein
VLKELFEDQFFQVVLRAQDNPPRGTEGLAVSEGRTGGQNEEVVGAQFGELFEGPLVVGIEMNGGAVPVAERGECGGQFVERSAVAALEEFVDVVRAGAGVSEVKIAAWGRLRLGGLGGSSSFHR